MKHVVKEVLTIQEAMDNLASIAEINMEYPPLLGVVQGTRIVTSEADFPTGSVRWLSEEGEEPILEILDRTYRTVHQYLVAVYDNPETDWESKKLETGIAATMSLVGESANKMDRYLAFREGKREAQEAMYIAKREEFQALQQFYLRRFLGKFGKAIAGEDAWQEEWADNVAAPFPAMSGLKDFETVRRDEEYELFYIRNENGDPYFNNELLRNIKLTVDLESESETFEEDPLLKVRTIQDRDLQASADQILIECNPLISDFFKILKKLVDNDLAKMLSLSIVALLLSANPRNLLQNTSGKSSMQYFADFQAFLRASLRTGEYQKWIAYPPDRSDKIAHLLLSLTHALCRALFFRKGGVKQEAIGLIHRTMRRGEEVRILGDKKALPKGDTVWNQFLLDDERFRTLLGQFPNGPLFKILDLIREEEEENAIVPFDPIMQGNLPLALYQIERQGKKIDFLRIPSPVKQALINKCEIAEEFRGFLRALVDSPQKKKHLIVNLNDRTSWREYERSRAIEKLHMNAEHSKCLFVITLPKQTDFYYQNNEYLNLNRAEEFLEVFRAQLRAPEECGYYFPASWKPEVISRLVDDLLPLIHRHFFHSKETLSRHNREDFIEIFYQFLILKAIDELSPDSVSFTCKDGIDMGALQGATFYGFCKLFSGELSKKEELDFLRFLYYAPALFIRERAVAPDQLNRSLSALERLDTELFAHGKEIFKALSPSFIP